MNSLRVTSSGGALAGSVANYEPTACRFTMSKHSASPAERITTSTATTTAAACRAPF
jgi:hypothetical protein